MKFTDLALYLKKLEVTASRNEITSILADLFKHSDADEIDKISYLILGRLAPNFRSIVFNIADAMAIASLAQSYQKDTKEIKDMYKKKGDLGEVAFELSSKNASKASRLSVSEVYEEFVHIANEEGEGSVERKTAGLANLLQKLDPLSAKYAVRIPLGKLRLGFSDKTLLDALSFMEKGDKSFSKALAKAFEVMPDIGLLAQKVKKEGVEKATNKPSPVLFVPVMPALAQRLKSPAEMIKKMEKVAVEPKFDGLRALIHIKKTKNGVKYCVFTRNLNDVGNMFPELEDVGKQLSADEVILDSEAVGMDPEMMEMADFQKTMQRRRKHDVGQTSKSIPLRLQVFDILYKDGKNLMEETYEERRKILAQTVKKGDLLVVDDYTITDDPNEIAQIHKKLRGEGLEGVVVKKLDSPYVAGRTGWRWVKMKEEEDSVAKLADTIDCVVMGYTRGKGKRVEFGVGQFLVGVRNKDAIVTLTKVGTGLTDEQFKELNKRLTKLVVNEKPKEYEVHKNYTPDFWVKPELVVEIAGDDLTKSPTHAAGYALRFPRLVKFRNDKSSEQITTIGEVKKLYGMQKV